MRWSWHLFGIFFAGQQVAASIAEGFGGGRPQFQGQGSSSGGLFSTIESFIGGGNGNSGRPPSQASSGGGFLNTLENLVFGTRRTDGPPPPQRPFRPPQRPFSRPPPGSRPVRRRPPPNRRPAQNFFSRRQDESGFRQRFVASIGKHPSPALGDPYVVHSNLRIWVLAYLKFIIN